MGKLSDTLAQMREILAQSIDPRELMRSGIQEYNRRMAELNQR